MSNDPYIQFAKEFRTAFEQPTGALTRESLELQHRLIFEEFNELCMEKKSLEGDITNRRAKEYFIKELTDLLYVIFQAYAAFGWDPLEAFWRVHQSNLSKLGEDGKPIRREDGKVLKGPNYKPPSLINLV